MFFSKLQESNVLRLGALILGCTKKPNDVFSDPESSVEDICVAHMCAFKRVIDMMDEIKAKFNLDDSTDWQSIVLQIASNIRPKGKGFVKNMNGKNLKSKTKGGKDKVKKFSKKQVTENPSNGESAATDKDESINANKKNKSVSVESVKAVRNKEKKENKKKTVEAIEQPNVITPAIIPTTVDPFFITDEGTNYISTAVVDRTQADAPDDGLDRRSRRAKQFNKSHVPSKFNASKNVKRLDTPLNKAKSFGNNSKHATKDSTWTAKRQQKTPSEFQEKKTKFNNSIKKEATEHLHPSWAAKQKQKPTISEFKGSKITFD